MQLDRSDVRYESTGQPEGLMEPMWTMQEVCELTRMSLSALYTFLSRRKDEFEARYHTGDEAKGHAPIRVLTTSEVRRIQEYVIQTTPGRGGSRKKGVRRPWRDNPDGPLSRALGIVIG